MCALEYAKGVYLILKSVCSVQEKIQIEDLYHKNNNCPRAAAKNFNETHHTTFNS